MHGFSGNGPTKRATVMSIVCFVAHTGPVLGVQRASFVCHGACYAAPYLLTKRPKSFLRPAAPAGGVPVEVSPEPDNSAADGRSGAPVGDVLRRAHDYWTHADHILFWLVTPQACHRGPKDPWQRLRSVNTFLLCSSTIPTPSFVCASCTPCTAL